MSTDVFRPNADSYHLLNDSTALFSSRLRLCRALWVSEEYVVPRKYQLLLNWLCGQMSSCVENTSDFRLCVGTMVEFLNSKCLEEHFASQAASITVKPIVAQTVAEYLTKNRDGDTIKCLKTLTEILCTKNQILCGINSQYEQQATFTSSWMNFTISQQDNVDTAAVEVIIFLIKRGIKIMRGSNAANKALLPFCKHLLLPMLKLHYKCSTWKHDDMLLYTDLVESLENYITSVLFTRKNSKLFDELGAASPEQKTDKEELNRRNKKVQRSKRLAAVMATLQEIATKNSSNESCAAHCIQLFFRLFLTHSNCDKKIGISMLLELAKFGCMDDQKCSDIVNCENLSLETMKGLLQVTHEQKLYQPAVNQEQGNILLAWLKSIMENLVEKHSPSSSWISCASTLVEIDKAIVESKLKSVLFKLIEKDIDSLSFGEMHDLVHRLVDVYVRNRQSLRLVNLIVIVIEGYTHTENTDADSIKRITDIVEEFASYLGKQFTTKLSPSLVIEIWSFILEKVTAEVTTSSENSIVMEEIVLATTLKHQLLLKCFNKIVEKSPIFALWDHMTVRKKLDECIKTFQSFVEILSCAAFSKQSSVNQKLMENLLLARLTQMEITNLLENYVEVNCGSISPGLPTSLFKNESTLSAASQKYLDDINPYSLVTTESKLYFIELSLIKVKNLSNEILIVEISDKTGRLSNEECSDLHAESKKNLDTVIGKLVTLLQCIKPSMGNEDEVATDPDTFFLQTLVIFSNFSAIIFRLDIPKLHEWVINSVVFVMFKETCVFPGMQKAITEIFSSTSVLSKGATSFDILCCSSKKLSEIIPSAVEYLSMSRNAAKQVLLDKSKNITDFSMDESKAFSSALTNHIKIFEHCNLKNLSLEEALSVFSNIISCIQITENLLDSHPEMIEMKILLKSLVGVLFNLTSGKMMLLLKHCNPVKLFVYFARLKPLIGSDMQKYLNALLQELIFSCYHNSAENAFALLKEGTAEKKKKNHGCTISEFKLNTLTLHIEALINILSFDEGSGQISSKKLNLKSRKRKLRDQVQTCKKLKLETESGDSQALLFDNLHQLYKDVVLLSKEENKLSEKSYYDMLSAGINAFTLLKSIEDGDIVKIDGDLVAGLPKVLQDISSERRIDILVSKLQFVRSCLQIQEIDYEYHDDHLKNLIQCYENILSHSQAAIELEQCICFYVRKVTAENFQRDVLNKVVYKVRFGNDKTAKNYLKFSLILLDSGLLFELAQSQDNKLEKSACIRFVKSLLETLTILISEKSGNVDALPITAFILMNKTISAIVKLKWVRLQTTEICSIFLSLCSIPLEKIHDTKGAELFSDVFATCCDVVHSVLLNHNEIGRIAAICNNSFRQLLKAAMHLGVQKASSRKVYLEPLHDDRTYSTAILCAGKLEKLFQLVADNYKKEFSKCMSYLVADYTCALTSATIVPFVKKSFRNAIYHLVSMMDEYDTAMIRKALPSGVRDNFQELFIDFGRNFRYKGFV